MIKLNVACTILILIFALIGCDQGQQMMKPVAEDVFVDDSVMVNAEPVQEPIIEFPIVIDGIVQKETREVFTSVDAAINSDRFHRLLEIAKEYNLEYCGKREKPGWLDEYRVWTGNPQLDFPEKFGFIDEATATEFEKRVNSQYAENLGNTRTVIPERFGWWGSIDIHPRCGR